LNLIDQNEVKRRVELERDPNGVLSGGDQGERARLLDQALDAFDAPFRLATGDEIAQPPDDLARAQRLLPGLVQRIAQLRGALVGALLEQPARPLQIVADRGERLIEFVRKRGGHLPHRAQARHVQQLRLHLVQQLLALVVFAEIAHESDELPFSFQHHLAHGKVHRKRRAVLAPADDETPTPIMRRSPVVR